jgi:hypothetical protein
MKTLKPAKRVTGQRAHDLLSTVVKIGTIIDLMNEVTDSPDNPAHLTRDERDDLNMGVGSWCEVLQRLTIDYSRIARKPR